MDNSRNFVRPCQSLGGSTVLVHTVITIFISIQDGATALTIASENGFTPIVEALCEAGANVDHINAVSSILHV